MRTVSRINKRPNPGKFAIIVGLFALVNFLFTPTMLADDKITAIKGGELYTITGGIIQNGAILIKEGRIWKIGSDVTIPKGAQVIDAKGKIVMPGLVAAKGDMGLAGSGGSKIADSLDPYNMNVSLALASGVTAVFVSRGSANAVIKPAYADMDNMIVKESVLRNLSFSQWLSKTNLLISLRKAQAYLLDLDRQKRDKSAGKDTPEPKKPSDVGTYLPLLKRETTALVRATSASDIMSALELVDEFGIRMIIDGGAEAWTVADRVAQHNVSVIITPRYKQRPNENVSIDTGSTLENAAILKKAGVKFAIVPPSTSFTSSTGGIAGRDLMTLPLEAAFAVSGGLDEQTALEAITITPARLLGVADRLGSLQPGKDADIIILDGHPFHHNTFVETTIVNGKVLYEKQKSSFFSHIKHDD